MLTIQAKNANSLWLQGIDAIRRYGNVHEGSRDQQTKEILHIGMTLTLPRQRLVFSHPLNPAFLCAEIVWILAGFNSVKFLDFWNPRMKDFSDDGEWFHGAYGARIGCGNDMPMLDELDIDDHLETENVPYSGRDQLWCVYNTLLTNPNSRHAVMTLWQVNNDLPFSDGLPRSKDIPCNISSMLAVRDGKLFWMQTQRSQDAFWGLPTNVFQWTTIMEVLAGWLNMDLGTYSLCVNSFHAYERHWQEMEDVMSNTIGAVREQLLDEYEAIGEDKNMAIGMAEADLLSNHDIWCPNVMENPFTLGMSYERWCEMFPVLVESTEKMSQEDDPHELLKILGSHFIEDEGWQQMQKVMCCEALRRRGFVSEGEKLARELHPFWYASLMQWFERKESK